MRPHSTSSLVTPAVRPRRSTHTAAATRARAVSRQGSMRLLPQGGRIHRRCNNTATGRRRGYSGRKHVSQDRRTRRLRQRLLQYRSTPDGEDRGVGATDPFGNALSFARNWFDQLRLRTVADPVMVDPCLFSISSMRPPAGWPLPKAPASWQKGHSRRHPCAISPSPSLISTMAAATLSNRWWSSIPRRG